jgi:pyrimidine deaminase RibD-like protein
MPVIVSLADRVVKTVSDFTVGTVIVLINIVLAEREHHRKTEPAARRRGLAD